MAFRTAVREKNKLRLALDGPAKAGKTTTAIRLAMALGGKIAVIDSEQGKSAICVGTYRDGKVTEFDVDVLEDFSPQEYVVAISRAANAGYEVLVIDGLSPAWDGVGGALEQHDNSDDKNSFFSWRGVTKVHRRLLDAILNYPGHVIVTMRSKITYAMDSNDKGKAAPRRVGLAPVQRPGIEYEFDLLCSIDADHWCKITGSRYEELDGLEGHKPGKEFWQPLLEILATGEVSSSAKPIKPLATDSQVNAIRAWWPGLDLDNAIEHARLKRKYGVNGLHQLTSEQATEVIADLESLAAEKGKGIPTHAATPATTNSVPHLAELQLANGRSLQSALADEKFLADKRKEEERTNHLEFASQRFKATFDSYCCTAGLTDGTSKEGKAARKKLWLAIAPKLGINPDQKATAEQMNAACARMDNKIQAVTASRSNGAPQYAGVGGSPVATQPPASFPSS